MFEEKLKKIDNLKRILDDKRPFDEDLLEKLEGALKIERIYNSNAIEGNTLTLTETKLLIEDGLTISGKSFKEAMEAKNLESAIEFVNNIVKNNEDFNERVLKEIHYAIFKNTDNKKDKYSGKYRDKKVLISGSEHVPCEPIHIKKEIQDLFYWYEENKNKIHPILLAAEFHFRLVYIHPFIDGNGRTARLCMNLILMKNGFLPAIIKAKKENKVNYYKTLEEASINNNSKPFINLIINCEEEILNKYFEFL